jgi:hypothetical protein
MEWDESIYQLAEAWLDGLLLEEDSRKIRDRFDSDPVFREEFSLAIETVQIVRLSARTDLKARLLTQSKTFEAKKNFLPRSFIFAAAAAFLLLLLTGLAFQFLNRNKPGRLYDRYYELPGISSYRGNAYEADPFRDGLAYYKQADYQQAADAFRLASGQPQSAFYLGICFLELDQPDSALLAFSSVPATSISVKDAAWYAVLAHLKKGEIMEVRIGLEAILADEAQYHGKEASALLKKLGE